MNKFAKKSVLLALIAGVGVAASLAQAQEKVYVRDGQQGEVVVNNFGDCWRDGYWTPAGAAGDPAVAKCDPDLAPKVAQPVVQPRVVAPVVVAPQVVTLGADALFKSGQATLQAKGKKDLDKLAADLKAKSYDSVLITGHADRMGKAASNQKLSERRAAAVKAYLVKKGVPAAKISTEGKGSSAPVTAGKCDKVAKKALVACLQPDRRVVIEINGVK